MKNHMLNAIPKADFKSMVIAGTTKFANIYNTGIPIVEETNDKTYRTNAPCSCKGIKDEVAKADLSPDVKAAFNAFIAGISVGVSAPPKEAPVKKTSRYPNAEERAKQFLTFVPYAAVVCTRNRNKHSYPLNEPVIMMVGCEGANVGMYAMDKTGKIGTTGNELPRLRKSLRPATASEITWLVNRLYE